MNKIIIFYSYSGNSKAFAEKLQAENGADLLEVKEAQNRSRISAYTMGVKQARSLEAVPLSQPMPDLSGYTGITLVFPVWGGYPAPAFNSVRSALPKGADVAVYLMSAGGKTSGTVKDQIRKLIAGAGCNATVISDITARTKD